MKLKEGIDVSQIEPEVWLAAERIDAYCRSRYGHEITLTSGRDSTKHKKGSLHYEGKAVDIRSKDFPKSVSKRQLIKDLFCSVIDRMRFDLILEQEGGENEHFHLELDPK